MEHSERILENYEEAVFFLLFDELCEWQGKKYQGINKALQAESDPFIPKEIAVACRQTIQKTFQALNRNQRHRKVSSTLKKIAIAIAIMILLITSAFSAFPSFRAYTMNWVLDVMDDRTRLEFLLAPDSSVNWNMLWLPESYTCTSVSDNNHLYTFKAAETPEENWIVMSAVPRDDSRISVDTEDADVVEELEIRGFQSLFVEKDGFTTLVWNYTDTDYVITLMASNLNKDEICKMAENIYLS